MDHRPADRDRQVCHDFPRPRLKHPPLGIIQVRGVTGDAVTGTSSPARRSWHSGPQQGRQASRPLAVGMARHLPLPGGTVTRGTTPYVTRSIRLQGPGGPVTLYQQALRAGVAAGKALRHVCGPSPRQHGSPASQAAGGSLQPPVTMTVTRHSCWGGSQAGERAGMPCHRWRSALRCRTGQRGTQPAWAAGPGSRRSRSPSSRPHPPRSAHARRTGPRTRARQPPAGRRAAGLPRRCPPWLA